MVHLRLIAWALAVGGSFLLAEETIEPLNIACQVHLEEESMFCTWNCSRPGEVLWKICYSKDHFHWGNQTTTNCSRSIMGVGSSVRFSHFMSFVVAVGRNRSDCNLPNHIEINPMLLDQVLNPVEELRVDYVGSRYARLSWLKKLGDAVCQCTARGSDSPAIVSDDTINFDRRTVCELEMLRPHAVYRISVQCKPENGSQWSKPKHVYVKTKEAAPSKSPTITQLQEASTSITVWWEPPSKAVLNGNVTGYLIKYTQNRTHNSGWQEVSIPGDAHRYQVKNLLCYTVYSFKMSATTVGESPYSETVSKRTNMCAPSAPRIRSVKVIQVEGSTRLLSIKCWAPDFGNGPVDGYVAKAEWAGESRQNSSLTSEIILRLPCPRGKKRTEPTVVRFRVQAVNYDKDKDERLIGPTSEVMEQTVCEPPHTKNAILLIVLATAGLIAIACIAVIYLHKKKKNILKCTQKGIPVLPHQDTPLPSEESEEESEPTPRFDGVIAKEKLLREQSTASSDTSGVASLTGDDWFTTSKATSGYFSGGTGTDGYEKSYGVVPRKNGTYSAVSAMNEKFCEIENEFPVHDRSYYNQNPEGSATLGDDNGTKQLCEVSRLGDPADSLSEPTIADVDSSPRGTLDQPKLDFTMDPSIMAMFQDSGGSSGDCVYRAANRHLLPFSDSQDNAPGSK